MRPYPLAGSDVSVAVRQTLMEHLPAQLAASPRPLPAPTSYEQVPTEEAIRRVFGSTLAVICRGTNGKPERRGDLSYDLSWDVAVVVWHQQAANMPLLTAAGDYAAAVRQVLTTHCPSICSSIEYEGEDIDLVGDGLTELTLGQAMVRFTAETGDTLLYTTSPDTSGPVVLTTHITHNP